MLHPARRPDSSPRFLFWFLIAGILAGALPAAAQMPPRQALFVTVTTDKPAYAPGERVLITVQVRNLLEQEQVLRFGSSLQADYVIDGAYRWSAGRAFLTVVTSVVLAPGATHVFPVFEHLPGDSYLAPGPHVIVGEVGDYAGGSTTIIVAPGEPTPTTFLLSPSITPNPAPFGAPVRLAVTVTNVSDGLATFGHDGCPVHFTIDGYYSPPLACALYWQEVTLEPGQSIEFGAEEYDYLLLNQLAHILTPGWHRISLEVPGAGSAATRLQVIGGGGSIGGRVLTVDGKPLENATVQGIAFAWSDSAGVPSDPSQFIHQAITGTDGSYRLENLPPDVYFLRAFRFDTGEIWYDGAARREQATPITLTEGAGVERVDFRLSLTPPPPPPVLHTYISGMVTDEPPPGSKQPIRPISGAMVAVLQVFSAADSLWVVPRDGPNPPVRPPPPPDIRPLRPPVVIQATYYGITDSLGRYEIRVPPGRYRALAGVPGYRYEWHREAANWGEADDAVVNNDLTDMVPIPTNFSLPRLPAEAPAAVITGVVRGYSPEDRDSLGIVTLPGVPDSVPGVVPLEGARVTARPLLENPLLMRPAPLLYSAITGPGGVYEIRLPADSPVIVWAGAEGCQAQIYDHVALEMMATPVDVTPDAPTGHIDFDLMQVPRPPDVGTIAGVVRSVDPRLDNRDCARCVPPPLAGALVRVRLASTGPGLELITRTDEQGYFAFNGLPLGPDDKRLAYTVSAEAPGHLPAYHPGVYRADAATPVTPTPPWIETFASTLITLPLQVQTETGPHFAVGLVHGAGGWIDSMPPVTSHSWLDLLEALPGDSTNPGLPDSTGPFWPLGGAFLYLVPADDAGTAPPVAGGVASDNGTLVLRDLPAGRYRACADRPGFRTGWFHGTGPLDAAVISIGPGVDPVLIHIQLAPLGTVTEPGEGGTASGAGEARIVVNLHNAPNPFQPQTTIVYRLMTAADVSVHVFDVNGRLVRTLFSGLRQVAGEQRVPWDGQDDRGAPAGSGIYFYLVATPGQSATGKMVMVR